MSDILTWTQHGDDEAWTSSGGKHQWAAIRCGDYGPGEYPWFLSRGDGLGTRVTNAERSKEIAELCERDARNVALFLSPVTKVKQKRAKA